MRTNNEIVCAESTGSKFTLCNLASMSEIVQVLLLDPLQLKLGAAHAVAWGRRIQLRKSVPTREGVVVTTGEKVEEGKREVQR